MTTAPEAVPPTELVSDRSASNTDANTTQTGASSPAAIERARAAWSGISWGTQMSWPQAEVEKVIAAFAAAIDAAASEAIEECEPWLAPNFPGQARDMVRALATPAPEGKAMTDQGASKTEINKRVQARYRALMLEGAQGHYETVFRVVHEERAAAASEARAAAIEECAKWHDAEAERICKLANEPRNACNQTAMYSAADDHENCAIFIRALATPAQAEGK